MADCDIVVTSLTAVGGDNQITANLSVSGGSCLGYLALDKFEVWAAASNNRALAVKVGETSGVQFTHAGLGLLTTRFYWARARDVSGNLGDFYPASSTAGASATTKQKELVPGSVGEPELGEGAVTETKIANLAVGSAKIAAAAITEAKIANAAITNAKIGNLEVNSAKIANLTIGTTKVADFAMSSPVIYSDPGGIMVSRGLGNVWVAGASKAAINPLGRVEVTFTASVYATFNASQNWGSFVGTLYRNGVPVADCVARPDDENQDGLLVIRYVDTSPGAGSVSWAVHVQYISSPGPGANIACRNRYLSLLDFAK